MVKSKKEYIINDEFINMEVLRSQKKEATKGDDYMIEGAVFRNID